MMDYLLIEHKDRCGECRLIVFDERAVCGYNDRSVEIDSKPDWCPLRPLPDYKPEPDRAGWTNGEPITEELTDWLMDFGFNCCLEAITGGTHDETEDD